MGKKAVLIGCNYPGTKAELKGCINDVNRMHTCLTNVYGFEEDDITILIDTDESYTQPTGRNIRQSLSSLVRSSCSGDILFVHYSGHGTRLPAETGEEDDTGYDECIVPTDMNLITDDDFRDLVDRIPEGCRLTIVSDSCHSGGLIDEAKEQIGESTKGRDGSPSDSPGSGFTDFLNKKVEDALDSLPSVLRRKRGIKDDEDDDDEDELISRTLPLSTLIEMLKQKTGKEDINVGKVRPTLFTMFGEDSTPKVKKFMNVLMTKLQGKDSGSGSGGEISSRGGGFLGKVGDYLKEKLDEDRDGFIKPAFETKVERNQEAYAGCIAHSIPDNGILISGCQTSQTSADASPRGNSKIAYGALSNAIQTIVRDSDGHVSNHDLVSKAREMLQKEGYTQRPGLYCSDRYVKANFIC